MFVDFFFVESPSECTQATRHNFDQVGGCNANLFFSFARNDDPARRGKNESPEPSQPLVSARLSTQNLPYRQSYKTTCCYQFRRREKKMFNEKDF